MAGCKPAIRKVDLSSVDIPEIKIHDYGKALFQIDPDHIAAGLDSLYPEYRFFLGDDYSDTLNIIRLKRFITDPLIEELALKSGEEYPDLHSLEEDLTRAFRYIRYYLPSFVPPEVFAYISGLYYEYPVQYYDTVMLIGLDLYLGKDFEPYRAVDLPYYMTRRMDRYHIVPDCTKEIAMVLIGPGSPDKTLLDQMVYYGKILYFMDLVLPETPDTLKIGYTKEQVEWCQDNEKEIWAFLIEQQLLYTTDAFAIEKFIQDGPFTSGFPRQSPSMIGRWIGWQIIRDLMDSHPDVSLRDLFNMTDAQEILTRSGYKPGN